MALIDALFNFLSLIVRAGAPVLEQRHGADRLVPGRLPAEWTSGRHQGGSFAFLG